MDEDDAIFASGDTMNFLTPFLQIERGRVEAVGTALRLYRFRWFDLTVCFSLRYPRVAITVHE